MTATGTLAVRLDPRLLANPDAGIRYVLPDLIAARSGGTITPDGYDYVGDGPLMVLYLGCADPAAALALVAGVIETERVLGNDLRPTAVVAFGRDGGSEVAYPPGFTGPFLPG